PKIPKNRRLGAAGTRLRGYGYFGGTSAGFAGVLLLDNLNVIYPMGRGSSQKSTVHHKNQVVYHKFSHGNKSLEMDGSPTFRQYIRQMGQPTSHSWCCNRYSARLKGSSPPLYDLLPTLAQMQPFVTKSGRLYL